MTTLFTTILNMSITASYVAIAVIIMRLFFKRLPKIFSYALWSAVWIRLIFPFSFHSSFSFLRMFQPKAQLHTETMDYVPHNIGMMPNPAVDLGLNGLNQAVQSTLPAASPLASVNPMQIIMEAASLIWIIGIAVLLLYSLVSYLRVVSRLRTATLVRGHIFESDRITTPFVCGFIKPKIYIPLGLNENELAPILAHEQTHIRRLDYLIKPLAFLALTLHWFNPLMWLSFSLMSKDMEMSCDESVIRKMGTERKGSYSHSLLTLSAKRSGLFIGSPLAFGESHIKSRIKNILSYRKPTFWAAAPALVVTAALLVLLTANPKQDAANKPIGHFSYDTALLLANKTAYIGNNSKVTALVDAMPLPKGFARKTVELQTANPPYGITIHYEFNYDLTSSSISQVNKETFVTNSILLFSLIDNVEQINVKVTDRSNNISDEKMFTYTRTMAEDWMGGDVRLDEDNGTTLKQLIERINSKSFSSTVSVPTLEAAHIEKALEVIMSSPAMSSNPYDYIAAHPNEYESILKQGDEALHYLLAKFEDGSNNNGLKGHIMMALCKDLLGSRNNVTDESLSPEEWYSQLQAYKEIKLPDYQPNVSDWIEQLVYDAAVNQYTRPQDGFTIVSPTIYGHYEEENKLKIVVQVFSQTYKLYNQTLTETSGSNIPAAITFTKNLNGTYTLDNYLEAKDGSEHIQSIKDFCTMPVSNKTIEGLSDQIFSDSGKSRNERLMNNLLEHLKANYLDTIILKKSDGTTVQLT